MAENDPLSLNNYNVEYVGGLTLSLKLNFKDDDGNIIMSSQGRTLVTDQSLQTSDGKLLGTVTHKIISMAPTYELHQGGPKDNVIGTIKIPVQFMSTPGPLREIDIIDANNAVIAKASGSFFDSAFTINDSSGRLIAKVAKSNSNKGGGILQGIANTMSRNYTLSIVEKDAIPTIVLLEFLIVVELLLRSGKGSSPGLVKGSPLGGLGGGTGGFGGGGFGGGKIEF
jgi:uncharacterized protein YxjI